MISLFDENTKKILPKKGCICQIEPIGKVRETVTQRVWVFREKLNTDSYPQNFSPRA